LPISPSGTRLEAKDSIQMRTGAQTRGYILITTAVCSAALLECVGLATDVGYMQWQRLRAQTAADAAAAGAMVALQQGANNSSIVNQAQADAALNGFANGISSTTVTVNHPPSRGTLAGNSSAVEVLVERVTPTYFMALLGQAHVTVGARAVETVGPGGSGGGCVYTLSPSGSRAFQINGGSATYFSCGLSVASSSGTALHMEGSAVLYMKNGAPVSVVGGLDLTGGTRILTSPGNAPVTAQKITSVSDPLSYVSAPSASGMTVRGASNTYYDMNRKPTSNTIQPGVYCGGLSIGNTGGATFTLAPGVYVIAGGGLVVNSQAKVAGTGVTIYNTSGALSGVGGCNAGFSPFNIDGQANLNLSAPTSGSLAGMLFFQDRNITTASSNNIQGGSTTVLNGAIYLPHGPLLFSGNNSTSGYTILVADTISINGNSNVNADYSSLPNGSPVKGTVVVLAE
jgi:hypothetical protein